MTTEYCGNPNSNGRQRGFTLIELSIVIAIAAVVLGAVLALVNAQMQNARATSMRSKMETIRSALVMFVGRHNRLPCPAIESLPTNDPNYGLEAPVPGNCTGATITGTVARGMIPFRSLGIAEDDAIDVYASRLTYVVRTVATNLNATNIAGATGTITLHNDTPPSPGLAATGNQINACSTTAGDNGCNSNAIVLVLSHGPNAAGAFLPSGQRMPLPGSARELENTNGDERFVLVPYSETDPVFDDTMLVLTPDLLLASLIRDGAIRSARSVTNERLQTANDSVAAFVLNNNGAVPNDPIPTLPAEFRVDGWGTLLVYARSVTDVCAPGTTPETVAFTITSFGPNRIVDPPPVGANDDIIRQQLAGPLQFQVAKFTAPTTCPRP